MDGIAKGIRRIVAVTGNEAHEVQQVAKDFDALLDSIAKLPFGEAKEKQLKETNTKLGQLSISVLQKAALKTKFTKIEKSVKDEVKARTKADSKLCLDSVKNYFTENPDAKYFVSHVNISSNAKIITEAINLVKKQHKEKSLFLITGLKNDSKVAQGTYLSNEHLKKLPATDVATLASKFIGGRAGGKGNVVQGMGTEAAGVDEAIDAVTKLLSEKL
ncbi:unnamed protein product [Ambrosiozyma monospora]|uniref:Unnamed protein product n=1 Tax=Ambrosiozyma monospora TaxID=43982 RepID=A0A9W7DFS8_AMBMO|nr:unnamed protein product [Ambrosiozyma monospora]